MAFDKRLHRLFPSDLSDATRSYDRISVELGNRFRDRVREMLASIFAQPESFAFAQEPLRAAMINGFPYLLLFRIVGTAVYVAGLYHASSDPKHWLDRESETGKH